MKIFRLSAELSEIRRGMPKVLRRDDSIQLRMTNYVSRHSIERRLEAYTFGCGRLTRKATADAPFNPLGEITS